MTCDQLALDALSRPVARLTNPDTSHAAAASVGGGLEPLILAAFGQFGPMIDDEVAERIPQAYAPSVKTARSRLARDGFLVATGEKRRGVRRRLQREWCLA